ETFPGQHQPIIDQPTWDAAQRMLAANRVGFDRSKKGTIEPSLLTGLIFDEAGDRLSPSHAVKQGRRYRYYISHRLMQANRRDGEGWRLPARDLEGAVLAALSNLFKDRIRLITELRLDILQLDQLEVILAGAEALAATITTGLSAQHRILLDRIVRRIDLAPGALRIRLNRPALYGMLSSNDGNVGIDDAEAVIVIEVPFSLRRRGVEAKLVIAGA